MKYSIRTLLLLLTTIGVLCAIYYKFYILPLKADLPFSVTKLDNDLEIKLWAKPNFYSSVRPDDSTGKTRTITSAPKTGQSLFAEIRSAGGQLIFPLCEMDVDFEGPTDSVSVAYTDDRNFAAIFSQNNSDILILADFKNQTFASPMTIWSADSDAIRKGPPRAFSDISPGPVRVHWQAILQEIRNANPKINVEWNCL